MPDFGIGEALAAGLTTAGVGAETATAAAPFLAGGLEGAALGAGGSLFTGGDPLTGALTGGLTGGAIGGLGPAVGEAAGIGATGGDALVGAGAGAIGSAITGQNPLSGALTGGAGGLVSGALGGAGSTAATTAASPVSTGSAAGTGGGTSAASASGPGTPVPVGGGTPVDLTGGAGGGSFGLVDANGNPFASATGTALTTDANGNPFGAGGTTTSPSIARTGATGSTGGGTDIGSKIMGLIEKNPGVLLAGGLLGANMLMGDQPLPAEAAIQRQAGEAQSQARTLAAYQQSGTLPPGLQAVVDQQYNAAKAAVTQQFANAGLGNSSMMVDKLNQLKQQKAAEVAQFADNLAKQGVQWANLSAQEFNQLLNAQLAQDQAFTRALGSFASGLAGLKTSSASSASTA